MGVDAKRAGMAFGIFWGLSMFLTTLASVYFNYGTPLLEAWGSLYPGYEISIAGSIIGLVYGFIDGFVMAYIVAWLYNRLGKR